MTTPWHQLSGPAPTTDQEFADKYAAELNDERCVEFAVEFSVLLVREASDQQRKDKVELAAIARDFINRAAPFDRTSTPARARQSFDWEPWRERYAEMRDEGVQAQNARHLIAKEIEATGGWNYNGSTIPSDRTLKGRLT